MIRKVLFMGLWCLVLGACARAETVEEHVETGRDLVDKDSNEEDISLPSPASVFCEEQGYEIALRDGEAGTYGVCLFPDGSECEEWAYFGNECRSGDSLLNVIATPTTGPSLIETTVVQPAATKTAVLELMATAVAEMAEDGCLIYENQELGYTFHYPADALIDLGDDPQQSITVQGALVDDEYWPIIYISHPRQREGYQPPADTDLAQWLIDQELLAPGEQQPTAEARQADTQIAGLPAVHTRFDRSPHSYAYDKYFFAAQEQLYVIVILHTEDKEDWALYGHFLDSFRLAS